MQPIAFHEIWVVQCDAARRIQTRFGAGAALDYLVGEKLLNFIEAATTNTAFARELPRFVSEVRAIFSQEQIQAEITRIERNQRRRSGSRRHCRPSRSGAATAIATEAPRLSLIKELLLTPVLGTA